MPYTLRYAQGAPGECVSHMRVCENSMIPKRCCNEDKDDEEEEEGVMAGARKERM